MARAGLAAEDRLLFSIADALHRKAGALEAAADLLYRRGYSEQAHDLLSGAVEEGNEPAMRWVAEHSRPSQAIPLLRRLVTISTGPERQWHHNYTDGRYLRALAGALIETGEDIEALPVLRQLGEKSSGQTRRWVLREMVRIYTDANDIDTMVAYLMGPFITRDHRLGVLGSHSHSRPVSVADSDRSYVESRSPRRDGRHPPDDRIHSRNRHAPAIAGPSPRG